MTSVSQTECAHKLTIREYLLTHTDKAERNSFRLTNNKINEPVFIAAAFKLKNCHDGGNVTYISLPRGYVTNDTTQTGILSLKKVLSLSLFMFWIFANDSDGAFATNDFTFLADRLY